MHLGRGFDAAEVKRPGATLFRYCYFGIVIPVLLFRYCYSGIVIPVLLFRYCYSGIVIPVLWGLGSGVGGVYGMLEKPKCNGRTEEI